MMASLVEWLEQHQLPCLYKQLLGIHCPGCGSQRALIELLKGNLLESVQTYPPLLPVLFLFVFLGMQLVFKFRSGAFVLKVWAVVTGVIMTINYTYSFFSH